MIIKIQKFGDILTSRQSGKEAFAAFLPTLMTHEKEEDILVDFDSVLSFSPSWGDEFLTPLVQKFGKKVVLKNTKNPSVDLTIELLEEIHGYTFRKN